MIEPPATSHPRAPWRDQWREIIFGHDTFAGRVFDVILLLLIFLSVLTVLLESVKTINDTHGPLLRIAEWTFTILFTIEYLARLATATSAARYARSFFGIVDFLAIGPVYLSLLFGGTHSFAVFRALRLLRVFRILKLTQFVGEAAALRIAIAASMRKIVVFLFAVVTVVIIVGALMYQIEGEQNGFTSIPAGMYWAVVTVTTVGYGDYTAAGNLGHTLSATEALIGQIYLVTVVSVIVSNLRRHPIQDRSSSPT